MQPSITLPTYGEILPYLWEYLEKAGFVIEPLNAIPPDGPLVVTYHATALYERAVNYGARFSPAVLFWDSLLGKQVDFLLEIHAAYFDPILRWNTNYRRFVNADTHTVVNQLSRIFGNQQVKDPTRIWVEGG